MQVEKLHRLKTLYSHGKAEEHYLRGSRCSKSISPTPSTHIGEASDTGNAVQDLRNDVDSLEGGMSWIGASSKMPIRSMQTS